MGLDTNGTRFLLYAKALGINFAQTAMVGRQCLCLGKRELRDAFEVFGYVVDEGQIDSIFTETGGYAEQMFTCLGATSVHSFDNSRYEGATHLHDFNKELPPSFRERYTTVLDGGSLEHIFNFPVAIKNCMEMVSVGGHYLGITPANNFMGHGFYQFSPELYFSVFTRVNGFELIDVIAYEDRPKSTWYSVKSPTQVKDRITLVNSNPAYLLILAKKFKKTHIFESYPQQSDYFSVWNQTNTPTDGTPRSIVRPSLEQFSRLDFIKRRIPRPLKILIRNAFRRSLSGFQPRFFRTLDPTENVHLAKKSLQ